MSSTRDEALERRIVKIMATPARYDYPEPERVPSGFGYDKHECPVCGQLCMIHGGGYAKHFTATHAGDHYKRQIAKRIIAAVRGVRAA